LPAFRWIHRAGLLAGPTRLAALLATLLAALLALAALALSSLLSSLLSTLLTTTLLSTLCLLSVAHESFSNSLRRLDCPRGQNRPADDSFPLVQG